MLAVHLSKRRKKMTTITDLPVSAFLRNNNQIERWIMTTVPTAKSACGATGTTTLTQWTVFSRFGVWMDLFLLFPFARVIR